MGKSELYIPCMVFPDLPCPGSCPHHTINRQATLNIEAKMREHPDLYGLTGPIAEDDHPLSVLHRFNYTRYDTVNQGIAVQQAVREHGKPEVRSCQNFQSSNLRITPSGQDS